ncbi:homeobox domain-containing protein [Ditylenchus destructor]|nr:homeobox domain-containing protein [Ditylenchus destructor]
MNIGAGAGADIAAGSSTDTDSSSPSSTSEDERSEPKRAAPKPNIASCFGDRLPPAATHHHNNNQQGTSTSLACSTTQCSPKAPITGSDSFYNPSELSKLSIQSQFPHHHTAYSSTIHAILAAPHTINNFKQDPVPSVGPQPIQLMSQMVRGLTGSQASGEIKVEPANSDHNDLTSRGSHDVAPGIPDYQSAAAVFPPHFAMPSYWQANSFCSTSAQPPWYGHYPGISNIGASKKGRQTYHRDQTLILERQFQQTEYVSKKQRDELRSQTTLNDRQIKIWFQNRRMKKKKEKQRSDEQDPNTLIPANPPNKTQVTTNGNSSSSGTSMSSPAPMVHSALSNNINCPTVGVESITHDQHQLGDFIGLNFKGAMENPGMQMPNGGGATFQAPMMDFAAAAATWSHSMQQTMVGHNYNPYYYNPYPGNTG